METVKFELPIGYKLACDHMRAPREGEYFLACSGDAVLHEKCYAGCRRIVLKPEEPKWEWPPFIKAKWMVCNEDMKWILCDQEPVLTVLMRDVKYWQYPINSRIVNIGNRDKVVEMFKFEPPVLENDDWRLSKRMNPKYSNNT